MHTERVINFIQLENGQSFTDPVEINTTFSKVLRRSVQIYPDNPEKHKSSLDHLKFQNRAKEDKKSRKKPLCIEEIIECFISVNSGKALGLHGLPLELYKSISRKLLLHHLEMFNETYVLDKAELMCVYCNTGMFWCYTVCGEFIKEHYAEREEGFICVSH